MSYLITKKLEIESDIVLVIGMCMELWWGGWGCQVSHTEGDNRRKCTKLQ